MSETLTRPVRSMDWINTAFLAVVHVLGVWGIYYLTVNFSWWTLGLGLLWFAFCGLSITGGYHRLFSHPTYKAAWPLRLFYALFGAASVQNSAIKWSSDHRRHHGKVDTYADPYNINEGFWWAHIGWVLHKLAQPRVLDNVNDLKKDPILRFQHKYYVPLAVVFGGLLPWGLGFLWGDPVGALLVAGFTRLMIQYHATFAVNSVAHYIGKRPYSDKSSARDSFITAIITLGEGYHNFHHSFQLDYRNGVRWWQLDPTKWFVWTMSKVGVTSDLRRVSNERIEAALLTQREATKAA